MSIIEITRDKYIASPFSKEEIDVLKQQQQKWSSAEKRMTLQFLIIFLMVPLCIIGLVSTWQTVGIGMVVSLIAFIGFKLQLPHWLDSGYPCSVVIDGEEFVKPYCNGLVSLPLEGDSDLAVQLNNQLKRLGRTAVRFELDLVK